MSLRSILFVIAFGPVVWLAHRTREPQSEIADMKPFILVEVSSGCVEITVVGDTQVNAIVLDWDVLGNEPDEAAQLIDDIRGQFPDGVASYPAEVMDAIDKLEEIVDAHEDEEVDEDDEDFEDEDGDFDDEEELLLDEEDEDDLVDLEDGPAGGYDADQAAGRNLNLNKSVEGAEQKGIGR